MDILFTLKLVKGVFAILDLFVWARLIISWIPHDPYNDITRIVYKATEPMLKPSTCLRVNYRRSQYINYKQK